MASRCDHGENGEGWPTKKVEEPAPPPAHNESIRAGLNQTMALAQMNAAQNYNQVLFGGLGIANIGRQNWEII